MLVRQIALPEYNVQTAVDAEHALGAIAACLRRLRAGTRWLRLASFRC
jgi:hypothetical protein